MLKDGWFQALEPVDITRAVFCFIGVGASAVFGSQRTWLKTEMMINLASGLCCVSFPSFMLEFVTTGQMQQVHLLLTQLLGAFMLLVGLIALRVSKSRDENVLATYFISRTLMCVSYLVVFCMAQSSGYNTTPGFKTQHVLNSGMVMALMLLGNLRQVFGMQGRGGSSESRDHGRVNTHLMILVPIMAMSAFLHLGHTEFDVQTFIALEGKPDILHLHMLRVVGTIVFGTMIFYFMAINFHEKEMKKSLLLIAAIFLVTMIGFQLYGHFILGEFTMQTVLVGFALNSALTANCIAGYYSK